MAHASATHTHQAITATLGSTESDESVAERSSSNLLWLLGLTAVALLFAAALSFGLLLTASGVPGHVGLIVAGYSLLTLVIGGAALGYVLAASERVEAEAGHVDAQPAVPEVTGEDPLVVAPRVAPRAKVDTSFAWPEERAAKPRLPHQVSPPALARTQAVALQLEMAEVRRPPAVPPIVMPKAKAAARSQASTTPPARPNSQPRKVPVAPIRMPARSRPTPAATPGPVVAAPIRMPARPARASDPSPRPALVAPVRMPARPQLVSAARPRTAAVATVRMPAHGAWPVVPTTPMTTPSRSNQQRPSAPAQVRLPGIHVRSMPAPRTMARQ